MIDSELKLITEQKIKWSDQVIASIFNKQKTFIENETFRIHVANLTGNSGSKYGFIFSNTNYFTSNYSKSARKSNDFVKPTHLHSSLHDRMRPIHESHVEISQDIKYLKQSLTVIMDKLLTHQHLHDCFSDYLHDMTTFVFVDPRQMIEGDFVKEIPSIKYSYEKVVSIAAKYHAMQLIYE